MLESYPMPPSPTSATREAGVEHFWSIWFRMSPRPMKSKSRRKGTVHIGASGVSGLSAKDRATLRWRNSAFE
jgi:hypothetical protein